MLGQPSQPDLFNEAADPPQAMLALAAALSALGRALDCVRGLDGTTAPDGAKPFDLHLKVAEARAEARRDRAGRHRRAGCRRVLRMQPARRAPRPAAAGQRADPGAHPVQGLRRGPAVPVVHAPSSGHRRQGLKPGGRSGLHPGRGRPTPKEIPMKNRP